MPGYDEYDEDDREDDYEPDHLRDEDREGCVLGDRCCPHPYHGPEECFTAEWAAEYFGDAQPAPVRHEREDRIADEKWRQG
jgi:hypothetical protein